MSRALLSRLRKREAQQDPPPPPEVYVIYERPGETADEIEAEMIAAGKAKPGDHFIVIRFMAPGPSGPERVFHPDPEGFTSRAQL